MKGGLRQKSDGFTILEVLIVLAVTGALFVSAIVMMSGRQRQAEFNTSIRDIQSQLQQAMSEVGNGFYPSQNNFKCDGLVTGPSLTTITSKQQGSNEGCIFIGKIVQFGYMDVNQPEQLTIYSAVGLRQVNGSGKEVSTLAEAKAKVIAPADGGPANMPDATEAKRLKGGLRVRWARINGVNNPANNVGAVGFMNSLASYGAVSGAIESGAQTVEAYAIKGTKVTPPSISKAAQLINTGMATSTVLSSGNNELQVCIDSGTTKQSGLITIGGNGRELSVELQIRGNVCPA